MLNRFFIICSGADTDILKNCTVGEQNKYAGIGATVFFTALMAFIASSYALYTVFNNLYTSVFFGFIWGLLIFNLDRYIVSTIKKTGNIVNELAQATPRLILATIIAMVISKPLELKIFEKEINQVLLEQKNNLALANKTQIAKQFNPEIEALKKEVNSLQQQIKIKEAEVNNLYDIYIAEAEGTAGTKLLGKGPVYKEKREKHDAALAELNRLKAENGSKIMAIESQITQIKAHYNTKVSDTQPIINNFDGLMARVDALGELSWFPSLFIFLLFLAVETTPVFAKLLSPKGTYDYKLEDIEDAAKNSLAKNKNQRAALLKTDILVNDKVYTDIAQENELYTYKRKKVRELMQLQADAFYNKQKSVL
ncbi:DUF4407 domain-containing protein [Flavobacteriaceae bacterium GSB9]|nr:DUF4407 domain-containing protein [Flavobacteriaceae bacterium GSB9]